MLLILKFSFNSFNICLLKSIETYFVWYQNCWKHNLFKFPYQCIVIATMLIITMSHLVLLFLILNLTHVCSVISFGESLYCAGTIQLICGANHLTGSCMVRVFAGGCFRPDVSCLIFCQYCFYHWFSLYVTGLSSKSSIVFFFIYPCRYMVFCGAQG